MNLGRVVGPTGPAGPAGPKGDEPYKFGHGLKMEGDTVSVAMASDDNPDRTLPISAAAVDAALGNIEILLRTIRGL